MFCYVQGLYNEDIMRLTPIKLVSILLYFFTFITMKNIVFIQSFGLVFMKASLKEFDVLNTQNIFKNFLLTYMRLYSGRTEHFWGGPIPNFDETFWDGF